MKTIIIACGSGIATSTVICDAVESLLNEHHIAYQIIQCSMNEVDSHLAEADLVVSSMPLTKVSEVPNVVGLPYLIGVGIENLNQEILECLREE